MSTFGEKVNESVVALRHIGLTNFANGLLIRTLGGETCDISRFCVHFPVHETSEVVVYVVSGGGDNNNKTSSSINGRLTNVSLARFKNPMEHSSFTVCCPFHLSDVILSKRGLIPKLLSNSKRDACD